MPGIDTVALSKRRDWLRMQITDLCLANRREEAKELLPEIYRIDALVV